MDNDIMNNLSEKSIIDQSATMDIDVQLLHWVCPVPVVPTLQTADCCELLLQHASISHQPQ